MKLKVFNIITDINESKILPSRFRVNVNLMVGEKTREKKEY